jgi:hypothetical protein
MKFEKREFVNKTFDLDGNEFSVCTFRNCKFVFRGLKPTVLEDSFFLGCSFLFAGPAANTLNFMAQIYHRGGNRLVEEAFENIRKNPIAKPLKVDYS